MGDIVVNSTLYSWVAIGTGVLQDTTELLCFRYIHFLARKPYSGNTLTAVFGN